MIVATIAYRLDGSQQNTWKIYLTHDGHLRRKPIGRVLHKRDAFWAEYEFCGVLELCGPFSRLETAAKVVAQQSYDMRAPLFSSLTSHPMPTA